MGHGLRQSADVLRVAPAPADRYDASYTLSTTDGPFPELSLLC
jgi:hypothetical protein